MKSDTKVVLIVALVAPSLVQAFLWLSQSAAMSGDADAAMMFYWMWPMGVGLGLGIAMFTVGLRLLSHAARDMWR